MRSIVSRPQKNSNLRQLTWYLLRLLHPPRMNRPTVICLVVFMNLHASDTFPVRLVGGPNLCVGRVEIFHKNKWGTVCDDDWDIQDATVVCREMSCGEALSAPHGAWFGEGAGPIWLNEVRCVGSEWYLHTCHHLGFRRHVCTHEEDASVICSDQRFPPLTAVPPESTTRRNQLETVTETGPHLFPTPAEGYPILRLVGGQSHCSGRLEIFHDGQWGTVCDDMWDLLDVAVVCRELDCGEALAAPGGAFFGEGNNIIWLDDVQCQGEEPALTQCHASAWGTSNCRHSEDAGAVCSGEMPLAMVEENIATLTRTLAPQTKQSPAPKRILRPPRPTRRQKETAANEVSHREKSPKERVSGAILTGKWKRLSLPKPSRNSNTAQSTTTTSTTDGVTATVEPGLHTTLHAPETVTATQDFSFEWEMEQLYPTSPKEPSVTMQVVELELEQNSNPTDPKNTIGTTPSPEIQRYIHKAEPAITQNIRPTTQEWIRSATYPTVEFRSLSIDQELVSEREAEITTQRVINQTMFNSEVTHGVQEGESSSSPMTMPPLQLKPKPTSSLHIFQDHLTTGNMELEKETETTSPLRTEYSTTAPAIMLSTGPSRTMNAHEGEQEPTYSSVKYQPSSSWQDLGWKTVIETTTYKDMDKTAPNLKDFVRDIETTSSAKTWTVAHWWWGKFTSSSAEFLTPLNMDNQDFEKHNETTSPSETEYSTATEVLKSETVAVPSVHWDNTSEEPLVTQKPEAITSSAEAQPTTVARWAREPEEELETIGYLAKRLSLSSYALEAKVAMDLSTTTEKEQSTKHLEAVTPQIQTSKENTTQQQMEGLNQDLQTMKSTASAFLLNTLGTKDGTDTHRTTDLPQSPVSINQSINSTSQSPVSHTVAKILQNQLMSSEYTEKVTSYPSATSAPERNSATGPNLPPVDPVTHHFKPSEATSSCPEESRREDQACSCSSPALGSLAHAMQGLTQEMGSLSTAIHHQGSKLEAVADSLAELAASVHHLVKVLPDLVQQAPARPSSVSLKENENPTQNQRPLK